MATRNVELVIRARDQAASAIKQINSALEEFVGAQKEITDGAGKTDSVLARLGRSAQNLNKAFSGSAAQKVATQLGEAQKAISKLEAATASAAGQAIGFTREFKQAGRSVSGLRSEADRVAAALKEQSAAMKESQSAQAGLTREIDRARSAREKLIAKDKQLAGQIDQQNAKLAEAQTRYAQLGTEIASAEAPSRRLQSSFEASANVISRTTAKLEDLRTTQAVVQIAIDQTATALDRAGQKLVSQESKYAKLETTVASLAAQQANLSTSLKGAEAAQASLGKGARDASAALEREDAALNQAQGELRELEGTADATATAMTRLAGAVRGDLLRAFGAQRAAVQQTQGEWAEAQARVKALAVQMRAAGQPSEELARAFRAAQQAAREAKAEFIGSRDTLQGMRGVLRESAGDTRNLAGQVDRMNRVYQEGQAALARRVAGLRALSTAENQETGAARQATQATGQLARVAVQAGVAQRQAAAGTLTFSDALRRFYGNSRTALSFTQRLRSEVLSLIAAYGGLFAILQGGRAVVDTFQQIEAAQNRLGVVFDQDQAQIGKELEFIRGEARRLGIEFGALAQEYTKFAVATKGSNLEGEETRRIFIRVAEAGRVNKLRLEDLKGVFVALSQIVSKGSVQMEELRQQLGDRLPGALQILAAGLGLTSQELIKQIELGQVSSDALSAFADELENRFGAQLPTALQSTTTAIGKFGNAVFEALEAIGAAGFIDSFTDFLRTFTDELKTADAAALLQRIGQAGAGLVDVMKALVVNFDLVLALIGAFVASRLAPFVIALGGQFLRLRAAIAGTAAAMNTTAAASGGVATQVGAATAAVRGMTVAVRGLLSATGVGLVITAIGAALGSWAGAADDATEAMARHKRIVDEVKQAYFEAEGNVGLFVERVREITTKSEAAKSFEDISKAAKEAREEVDALAVSAALQLPSRSGQGLVISLREEFEDFGNGVFKSSEQFVEAVDTILSATDGLSANARAEVVAAARAWADLTAQVDEAADVMATREGDMEAAARLAGDAAEETSEFADQIRRSTEQTRGFSAAMATLKAGLPGVTEQLERIAEVADLEAALQSAIKYAKTMGQVEQALALFQERLKAIQQEEALSIFGGAKDGLSATAALLKEFEGFQPTGTFDVNAFRAGFGSDTVTLHDGTIRAITDGMRVSMEDALRDLVRRIGEFQDVIRGQVGADRFGSFAPEQQAALTSIAYNYGSLPARIVEAVRSGTTQQIADAIRGLAGDNSGINANRRNQEAAIFEGSGDMDFILAQEEERLKLQKKQAEEREKAQQATAEQAANLVFQTEQQALINAGKEREAAIEEATRQARQANADITADEIASIQEKAGALFDIQNLEREAEARKKRAADAEREVNNLLTIRQQLTEQLKLLEESGGENDAINRTRQGIEEINNQLRGAIENTIAFYQALGGSDAEAAIAKLETLKLTLDTAGEKALLDFKKVGNLFADGMVSAFDSFAQAVANGEKATTALKNAFLDFAANFLRQIAQMILKQIILNALKSFGFGGAPVGHSGGIAGSLTRYRPNVNPAIFANAMRFHGGGIAGLRPDEVPIIAQKTEELVPDDDPRHRNNLGTTGAGSSAPARAPRIINAFDSASFLQEALSTPEGEDLIMNFVRANSGAIRQTLGT